MAKVAVLMGGTSFEREFSLISGKNICTALEEAGHRPVPLDTTEALVPTLRSERPDVVYNALHGKHGEDGTIQSLLEFLDIPFIGSPASVCHRSWNKDALHSSLIKYRQVFGSRPHRGAHPGWLSRLCEAGTRWFGARHPPR